MNSDVRPRFALSGRICSFVALSAFAAQDGALLRLLAIQGSQAENIVSQPARPIMVRVVDRNDRPVPDATVVFSAPMSGPGGDFADGSNSSHRIHESAGNRRGPRVSSEFRRRLLSHSDSSRVYESDRHNLTHAEEHCS